jgi:DNA-binding transcriptional LysR family regulator
LAGGLDHPLDDFGADAGFAPRIEHEAARAQAMLGLVAVGLGVTIVPETLARLPSPGVVFRPLK